MSFHKLTSEEREDLVKRDDDAFVYGLAARTEILEQNMYGKHMRVFHRLDKSRFSHLYGSLLVPVHSLRYFRDRCVRVQIALERHTGPILRLVAGSRQPLVLDEILGVYISPLDACHKLCQLPLLSSGRVGGDDALAIETVCLWPSDFDLKLFGKAFDSDGGDGGVNDNDNDKTRRHFSLALTIDVQIYPLSTPIRITRPLSIHVDEHRVLRSPPARAAIPVGYDSVYDRLIHARPPVNILNTDLVISSTRVSRKHPVLSFSRRLCATDR